MTFLSIAIYFRKYEREHMVLRRSHGHRGGEVADLPLRIATVIHHYLLQGLGLGWGHIIPNRI